jgi:hypothetical protein
VNPTDAVSKGIETSSGQTTRRRQVAVVMVFLICAGCFWLLMPNPAPQPAVTILPPDYSIPAPPLPIPDRWIPMTWRWLWRLRSAVLPANPTIDIETKLVRLGSSDRPLLVEILDGHTSFIHSNGVQAWIMSEEQFEEQLGALARRFEQKRDFSVRASRMTTGPGVLANQSMTTAVPIGGAQVPVGDSLTHAVRKRGRFVEHTGLFVSWEAVTNTSDRLSGRRDMISLRTNLTLAANLLIPPGQGVFLLDTNRASSNSSVTGLFISAKLR